MHEQVFATLADPTRRKIIEALRREEQSVGDIVPIVGIHQSGVSRHLGILAEAGFVRVRADGARRLYSLRPERFLELATWMGRFRPLWDRRRRDRRSRNRSTHS